MEPVGFGEDQADHAAETSREERIGIERKGLNANQSSRVHVLSSFYRVQGFPEG
jgi:hypothetical protein